MLALLVACGDDDQATDPEPATPTLPAPDLRLLVLTDLKGYLEPCGCTSHPLGGIDRMAARAAVLAAEAPTAMVVVGDLLFSTEDHGGPDAGEPLRWQAEAVLDILAGAGTKAVTPGADFRLGAETFEALRDGARFPFLARGWRIGEATLPGTHTLTVGDHRVALIGLSEPPEGAPVTAPALSADATAGLDESSIRIAMVRGDRRTARRIARNVDFVLLGGLDQEDALPPAQAGNGWVLHGGRQGQGLLVLDLYRRDDGPFTNISAWSIDLERTRLQAEVDDLEGRIGTWREEGAPAADIARQERRLQGFRRELDALRAPTLPATGNAFAARWEPIEFDAPKDPAVERRLAAFDRRVNEHNQEAFADRSPPPVDEGAPHYVGSAQCASCHQPAYRWWQGHPHGRAYATLQERHKEFHLTCVGCHVTGYERPGGSTVTHLRDGALTNVGCEVCHGPGSAHVAAPATANIQRGVTERLCTACHNEEHSDLFNFDAYRTTLLVPGHGRPIPDND